MTETLTKADLVEAVAAATGLPRESCVIVVNTVLETIIGELRSGSRVELRGFGIFGIRRRGARVGRNPRTGASVSVPAKQVVYFKPGLAIRELLNPPSERQ